MNETDDSKVSQVLDTNNSESSSGEETKLVETGADKHMDTISSSSSESAPLCQR